MEANALAKIGMIMQATGMGLKGQDGSAVYTRYNDELESEQRKEKIVGLMDRLGISGPKRELLSSLPVEMMTSQVLAEMQRQEQMQAQARRAGASAAASQATKAAEAAQWQAMQDALTGGGSAPQATPAGGDFSMGSTVQPVPTSGGMSFGVEAPSAPAVQPVPSSGGLSFGNIAPPAPAPAPSPYDMATQRLRRLYEMPPPQPGTPAAKSYKSMVDHYEGMVKAFEPEEVKVSEAEQEIARLESIGIPRAVAIRIKEGVYETARHPVTQEVQVIDKSTGQLVYGQSQPTTPAPIEPANTTPLEFGTPYESAESSFGIGGKLAGWLNTAGDVTGMGVPFPGIQSAQSDFGVMRENLTNRISEAYDGRVPAFLLKGIQDLTPKAGSLFEGPAAAQEKLEALGRNLTTERNSVQRQLTSRALSPTDRAKLETRLGTLESSLTEIRTAIVGFGSDQGLRPDVADRLKAYE